MYDWVHAGMRYSPVQSDASRLELKQLTFPEVVKGLDVLLDPELEESGVI